MAIKYLSKEHLAGFDNYKYRSIDTSPLSIYVTHPFWNQVVKILPFWLAPNLLTFTGFLLILLNVSLLAYYDYSFTASSDTYAQHPPIPSWVWLICLFNHFIAHTLDGVDGKQARRTNSSTPLGELFDHGLDSWAALFLPMCLCSVFGRADAGVLPLHMYFIIWNILMCFIISHWEKYITGTLFLPWGYDICQLGMAFIYLLSFSCGYKVWKYSFPFLNCSLVNAFQVCLYVGSLGMSLPMSLYNIYRSYQDRTGNMLSFYEAMRPLVAVTILMVLTLVWAIWSPYDLMNKDPRMFYWLTGTVFSNITCRLIINQMTNTRCDIFNWLLVPVALVVILVLTVKNLGIYELFLLWGLSALSTIAHVHFGYSVVSQLCDHLNIHCFSLKKPSSD